MFYSAFSLVPLDCPKQHNMVLGITIVIPAFHQLKLCSLVFLTESLLALKWKQWPHFLMLKCCLGLGARLVCNSQTIPVQTFPVFGHYVSDRQLCVTSRHNKVLLKHISTLSFYCRITYNYSVKRLLFWMFSWRWLGENSLLKERKDLKTQNIL